jgi:hypothetical protein
MLRRPGAGFRRVARGFPSLVPITSKETSMILYLVKLSQMRALVAPTPAS